MAEGTTKEVEEEETRWVASYGTTDEY